MKVLQGYRYSVTANEEVTVTDENGLNLTCPAGQQTYFTATCDEVEVSGDAVVTQARGHITIGSGGGGGGEKIAPGEVVLGGKNGTQTILDCNTLTDGTYQFYKKPYLVEFDADMPELISGTEMFKNCSNLTTFTGDLPKLTSGNNMFYECSSLTTFTGDLPKLTNGSYMFEYCRNLTSWNVDLPSMTNGSSMFYGCSNLTTFTGDLPKLSTGSSMFGYCSNLTSWNVDLPGLTSCNSMFSSCSKLTTFTGDLPKLSNGNAMFYGCKLDLASVNNIVTSLPTYTSGSHPIYIGVDRTKVTQEQQDAANTILVGKGWTATWQRN